MDDEDTFELERTFSNVFNSFVNQQYMKKDKRVFKLVFRAPVFIVILGMFETHVYKKDCCILFEPQN